MLLLPTVVGRRMTNCPTVANATFASQTDINVSIQPLRPYAMLPTAKLRPRSSQQVLDDEFLIVRAKILELAAALDRIERGSEPGADADRLLLVRSALEVLVESPGDRAEQVQLMFSRPYAADWRQKLEV